jgi:hypothetical protein
LRRENFERLQQQRQFLQDQQQRQQQFQNDQLDGDE